MKILPNRERMPICSKIHKALKSVPPGKHCLWLLICAASLGLSVLLQWNGQIQAIGGDHDSLKYLGMTETLLNGKWMGDYNQMTLIRLPIYPLFLALNSSMDWPLQRSQMLLYLASIGFLMAALRSVDVARWRIAAICVLCAFHPAGIFPSMYLATEAMYTSVATIVLAGCIGVMGSINKKKPRAYFWGILLSVSLALFWHIRSESLWILPLGIGYVCLYPVGVQASLQKKPDGHMLCNAVSLPLCLFVDGFSSK